MHWRVFALLGCFMIGSTTLILVALTMTSAINVSLINAIQPTLTVLFAWLITRHAPGGRRALGIACGLSGVLIVVSRADWTVLAGLDLQAGDFVALLAMCGFAGYALNLYRLPAVLSGVEALFGITVAGTVNRDAAAVLPRRNDGVQTGSRFRLEHRRDLCPGAVGVGVRQPDVERRQPHHWPGTRFHLH
jgi:drug/metabolite transporter (DMT)-like permease